MGSVQILCTVGTDALDHIVDALKPIAIGEDDGGDGGVAQAEGAMTALAIEVHMLVVVAVVTVVTMTELIAHAVAAILDDVYQVVLTKNSKCTEDTRLVNGQDLVFQLT